MLLAQQLQSNAYVDVREIVQLSRGSPSGANDQAMTFENYVADLTVVQGRLTLEETLYVLEVLLRGYEVALQKMGKVHIALDCCFLTDQGEVRAWVNHNHMSNECAVTEKRENKSEGGLQTSEVGAVKQIIRLSEHLPSNPTSFLHFLRHLRSFLDRDLYSPPHSASTTSTSPPSAASSTATSTPTASPSPPLSPSPNSNSATPAPPPTSARQPTAPTRT
jgi:hypothetical protein